MLETIHPANVISGDIVEFTQTDMIQKTEQIILPGTKAKFLGWMEEDGAEYALANVIPIGIGYNHWISTSPDILAIKVV